MQGALFDVGKDQGGPTPSFSIGLSWNKRQRRIIDVQPSVWKGFVGIVIVVQTQSDLF